MSVENDGKNCKWNVYVAAPMLFAGGIGFMFGAVFCIGKPPYACLIVAGAGLCVALVGFLVGRKSNKGAHDQEEPRRPTEQARK